MEYTSWRSPRNLWCKKMDVKKLLNKRRLLKKKKPEFVRQDAHKKVKVGWKWRKPKGSDSKMRVGRKGYKRSVRKGWGSPSLVKGLDMLGLKPVPVNNLKDLENINPQTDSIVIGSTVGTKKKMAIVEKALSKKITITNYKDPEKYLKKLKQDIESKKKEKEKEKEKRVKKREAVKKEAEKKKAKEEKEKKDQDKKEKTTEDEEELTEEEIKAEEKKEKDRLLITTQ